MACSGETPYEARDATLRGRRLVRAAMSVSNDESPGEAGMGAPVDRKARGDD